MNLNENEENESEWFVFFPENLYNNTNKATI